MEPLIVPSTLDSLSKISQYITSAATEAGLEKEASYKLRLAVDEIATNIITHGYNEAGLSGNISVQAEINEQNLTVYIEDTAIPFDPTTIETLTEEALKQLIVKQLAGKGENNGNRGLALAKNGVDEWMYERVGDRNRNILVVNRVTT